MRKTGVETAAAKPKPRGRGRAKPKPKPSPASPSPFGASSSSPSLSASPGADLSFLSPSSPAKPKTKNTPRSVSPLATPASMSSVRDLRGLAASSLDLLKRRLDALHADSARDLEASHSRLSKRFKMQTQSCAQLAEAAAREHDKMADKVDERTDAMKASYKKFVAEVQASTSRVCKVTVAELAKSVERAIDGLRSRYNISAT